MGLRLVRPRRRNGGGRRGHPLRTRQVEALLLVYTRRLVHGPERPAGREVDLVEDGFLLPFAVASAEKDKKLVYARGN